MMDFSHVTVLCVGDIMLDRFLYGRMERISPEAPVPVLLLEPNTKREMPGGAGNVANNILSLGGKAILIGVVGQDKAGETLCTALARHEGLITMLSRSADRPTICKTRFIATHQQVVRVDEESLLPLHAQGIEDICAAITAHMPSVQAVVVSDYGKGVCTSAVLACLAQQAKKHNTPLFVDPKGGDYTRYCGATCITPNLRELAQASQNMPVETEKQIEAAARRVMEQAHVKAMLVTRSEKGMMLVQHSSDVLSVPAHAREVFDVSGAGDTVIATLALAAGAGLSLEEAVPIANAAAGVVVGKLGTATVSFQEVMNELDQERGGGLTEARVLSLTAAQTQVAHWRACGLKIGFTNGCFDMLHAGHVSLLAQARAACDRLIVALNTDASIRRLKGEGRPVNALEFRAAVIAALRYVDAVVAFDEDTPLEVIRTLMPDVLIKGADYQPEEVVGAEIVQAKGGRLLLAVLQEGHSTTAVIERIRGR